MELYQFNNCALIEAGTATIAWEAWFGLLKEKAEKEPRQLSRDGVVCGEFLNAVTIIKDPTRNIIKSPDRDMPMRYAVGELLWYLSGSNRLSDISKFSTVWERMSDDGETLNSAYGKRIFEAYGFNQLEYIEKVLRAEPLSRQAVIHIKDPIDYTEHPTKDVPCTMSLQFLIRNGKLNLTTYMRSNDIWTGFPYDVFCFTCLQILLAFRLGVDIGTYTHVTGSLHLYQRNYDAWKKKQEGLKNDA